MSATLLILHATATLMLTGLIWFVQVVHYPLLARVGPDDLAAYAMRHTTRTTWVVAPLMLAELVTAILLVALAPTPIPRWMAIAGLALVAAIWLSTWRLQVPAHQRLARGDASRIAPLVRGNWIRTAAWSARSGLALMMLGAGTAV